MGLARRLMAHDMIYEHVLSKYSFVINTNMDMDITVS